jgi:hypothetical protein
VLLLMRPLLRLVLLLVRLRLGLLRGVAWVY